MKKSDFMSLLIAVSCAGCASEGEAAREAENNASIKRCADTGGMPVRSIWDDRFADCIYPQNKGEQQ